MVTRLFHLKSTIDLIIDPPPLDVTSAVQILKRPGFSFALQLPQHQSGCNAQSDDFVAGFVYD